MIQKDQDQFNQTIGRLDECLSLMILWTEEFKAEGFEEQANIQTLKHHAEDMIRAGNKILRLIVLRLIEGLNE